MNAKTLKSLKLSNHKLRRCRMNSLKCALLASAVTLAGLTTSAAWTVNDASNPTRITSEDGMILKVEVVSSSDKTLRISGVETLNDKTVLDLTSGVEQGWKVVAFKSYYDAYRYFESIVSVRAPLVETVGSYVFQASTTLQDVYFPSCTNISQQAFHNCQALTNAVFSSNLAAVGKSAFYSDKALVSFSPMTLTRLTSLGSQAFAMCSKLRGEWILDSPAITTLPYGVFWTNRAVTNFVFRKSAVTTLEDLALFTVAQDGGSVYFYHAAPTLGGGSAIYSTGKRLRIYAPNLAENKEWQELMAKNKDYFDNHKTDADYPGSKTVGMIKMTSDNFYSWVISWSPSAAAGLMLIIR